MPELPEVETMVAYLNTLGLEGQYLVSTSNYHRAFNDSSTGPNGLVHALGTQLKRVYRKAKYILIAMDNGTIVIHNKFTGFLSDPAKPFTFDYLEYDRPVTQKDVRFSFHFDSGQQLNFHDARCLGFIKYEHSSADKLDHLTKMGPDVVITPNTHPRFCNEWRIEQLLQKLHGSQSKRDIKSFLLDQSNQAGIGNIYVCEVLHICCIDPRRLCSSITDYDATRIHAAVENIMELAMTHKVDYDQYIRVFRQEKCQFCRQKIVRIEQAKRGTYMCPRCQI